MELAVLLTMAVLLLCVLSTDFIMPLCNQPLAGPFRVTWIRFRNANDV